MNSDYIYYKQFVHIQNHIQIMLFPFQQRILKELTKVTTNKRILYYSFHDYQYWSPKGRIPQDIDINLRCETCPKKVSREGKCVDCTFERLRSHLSPANYIRN